MSINKIYTNEEKIQTQKFNFLLDKFSEAIRAGYSLEEDIFIEGQVIDYIESIDNLSYKRLTEFDLFLEKDIVNTENIIKNALDVNRVQSFLLENVFLSNFNQSRMSTESIIGKIKRIKQKLAALDVWNNEFIKFVISEKFINFDNIGFNMISGNQCNVDTVQGVLTLPVKDENEVTVKSISIASGNGFSGNSNIEVDRSTSSLGALFDKNLNTWYEYERLDNGPVVLSLNIELASADIINCIELMPYSNESHFTVQDIKYSGNSRDYKSIKDLTLVENDSYYSPKEFSSGQVWSINFTPIKASTVTIVLKNANPEYINVQGVNKVSKRKRYSIGLKEIYIKKKRYAKEGSINSSNISLIENCYVGDADMKVIPANKTLYNIEFDVSTDSGQSWSRDGIDSSFLVSDEKKLLYKLNMIRNDNAFLTSTTFENEEDNSYLKTKIKPASKKISPNIISVHEPTASSEMFVFQDTFIRRSNSNSNLKWISKVKRLNSKIFNSNSPTGDFLFLPFRHNLSDYEIYNEEIEIYVDSERWEEVNVMSDLLSIPNTYYIKDDLKTIVFNRNFLDWGTRIKWKIKPQELFFVRREKGYYARFSNLFNPSKGAINIDFTRAKEKIYVEVIRKSKRIIKLRRKGIFKSSIKFLTESSGNNLDFVQESNKDDIKMIGNTVHYYFNEENSILYFPSNLNFEEIIKIQYKATSFEKLPEEDFEIWFEDSIPKGIYIKNEKFAAEDVEDVLVQGFLKEKFDMIEKVQRKRDDIFIGNKRAFTLSNRNIVVGTVRVEPEAFGEDSAVLDMSPIEVPFVDGKSEFLNLKTIENEKTNEIAADNAGFVSFKLSAAASFYEPLGLVFSDPTFTPSLNPISKNEYKVDSNGVVTVFVGVGEMLPKDINISYSYIDNTVPEEYKFSVDYHDGILYLSEELQVAKDQYYPKVFYKTSNYVASYDIVDQIKRFRFNKKSKRVEVDSQYLSENNKTLGIAYLVKDVKVTLMELRDYFTPFIDRIDFRFK